MFIFIYWHVMVWCVVVVIWTCSEIWIMQKKQRKHEYDSTSRENYDDPPWHLDCLWWFPWLKSEGTPVLTCNGHVPERVAGHCKECWSYLRGPPCTRHNLMTLTVGWCQQTPRMSISFCVFEPQHACLGPKNDKPTAISPRTSTSNLLVAWQVYACPSPGAAFEARSCAMASVKPL